MKKGILRVTYVPVAGSWLCGLMLMLVVSGMGCQGGFGTGYDPNPQAPVFPQTMSPGQMSQGQMTQGQVLPFGVTPQGQTSHGGAMSFGNTAAPFGNATMPDVSHVVENNAILPNQTQATYNTATQEMNIPFQMDTSRLLAFSAVVDNGVQTLTLVDPINRTLSVYHVYLSGPHAGKSEWKSTRNISADLKFDDYETMRPHPREVRALFEQKE